MMAGELIVMCSGAFIKVLDDLVPDLRRDLGMSITTIQGPSIGTAPRAIPVRLRRGEAADLVILFDDVIDRLADEGVLLPATKVQLAASGIGVAVRSGTLKPDIGSDDALRQALLAAASFAYSASASGEYVLSGLLPKLGLTDEVAHKGLRVEGESVGAVIARGGAELGFQQISEFLPVKGISILGPLPIGLQLTTILSAALPRAVRHATVARSLLDCLSTQWVCRAMIAAGLAPVSPC